MNTVKSLRQKGYKIYLNHYRINKANKKLTPLYAFQMTQNQNLIDARGGLTKMELTSPEGIKVRVESKCSKHDAFNKKVANSICLGRALKKLVNDVPF
jgi:hypothetical protein